MAPRKSNGHYCSAHNCGNCRRICPKKSFFRFPKETNRCKKWIQYSRRGDLVKKESTYLNTHNWLCADHFEDSQFMNANLKNKLVHDAVPTLFDVPNPPPRITLRRPKRDRSLQNIDENKHKKIKVCKIVSDAQQASISTTTASSCSQLSRDVPLDYPETSKVPDDDTANEMEISTENAASALCDCTPKKLQLKRQLNNERSKTSKYRKKIRELQTQEREISNEELITALRKKLPSHSVDFIESQLEACSKKPKGVRWKTSVKQISLALRCASSKAYKIFRTMFAAPDERTLSRAVDSLPAGPGINNAQMNFLKNMATNMALEEEKVISLCFDEMSFHGVSPALHVLLFVMSGLYGKAWKHPIAYYFTGNSMAITDFEKILHEVIAAVTDCGFHLINITCDTASANVALTKRLGVSKEQPFLMHNGNKIFWMFDPPHLVKCFHNNLKKYPLDTGNGIAKWDHIIKFYESDVKSELRLAPKISNKHLTLPAFTSMKVKVKLATQVLSHTVAAGMLTATSLPNSGVPTDAVTTAILIDRVDQLFDCMNSLSLKDTKEKRRAITSTSCHFKFLVETLKLINSWKFLNVCSQPRSLYGWALTINSVLQLWKELETRFNYKFLMTRRLNQDGAENLFSIVRQSSGKKVNPTAKQVEAAMKNIFISALLKPSAGANCQDDGLEFLKLLKDIGNNDPTTSNTVTNFNESSVVWTEITPNLKNLIFGNKFL